jgi:hypothetical protein
MSELADKFVINEENEEEKGKQGAIKDPVKKPFCN